VVVVGGLGELVVVVFEGFVVVEVTTVEVFVTLGVRVVSETFP